MKFQTIISILLVTALVSTGQGLLLKSALKKKLAALPFILQSGGSVSSLVPLLSGNGSDGDGGEDESGSNSSEEEASGSSESNGSGGDVPVPTIYYSPMYYTGARQVRRPVVYVRSTRTNRRSRPTLGNLLSGSTRTFSNIRSGVHGAISNILNPSTVQTRAPADVYFVY